MSEERNTFSQIIQISRPTYILFGVLFYTLGVGIADYLGYIIAWDVVFIGLACVTLLQLSSFFLDAYFSRIETHVPPLSSSTRKIDEFSIHLLQIAITILTIGAVLTVVLFFHGVINLIVIFFLGFSFFLAFFFAVPPLRLTKRGYGELAEAIFHAGLIPILAFLFQSQELHRINAMLTFPLVFLYIAMRIAQAFPSYASDIKNHRNSILTRLSWPIGVNIHNLTILVSYSLLIASLLFGLPWSIVWPSLLVIPLGIYQIWQMTRISSGIKPDWKILTYTSVANLALYAYLIAFTLWLG